MKQLELNLNKRLLIIENKIEIDGVLIDLTDSINDQINEIVNGKAKLICNGSELTEEILQKIVGRKYARNSQSKLGSLNFKNAFISAIEAKGYYWGENPIQKPTNQIWQKDQILYNRMENSFQQAESRTFNPEKTLIFEIL